MWNATRITIISVTLKSDIHPIPAQEITENSLDDCPHPRTTLSCPMRHCHCLRQAVQVVDLPDHPHHVVLCTALSSSNDVPQQLDHHQSRCFRKSSLRKHAACGKFSTVWTSCGQDARCPQFPQTTAHCSGGVDAARELWAVAVVAAAQLPVPPGQWNCSPGDPLHAKQVSKAPELRSWSASTSYLQALWHSTGSEPFC